MAERFRFVQFSPGGRPVTVLDLNAGALALTINSITFTPGQRTQQLSPAPGRYGGQQVVGETIQNGTLVWTALIQAADADALAERIGVLLAQIEALITTTWLEWRRDRGSFSSFFKVAGPGTWAETYTQETQRMNATFVTITLPTLPLVEWDRMSVTDPFDIDSRPDYVFDSATSSDIGFSGGSVIVAGAAVSVERRARHTSRGYELLEAQASLKSTPTTTVTGHKAGVILRASAPSTYVEAYVDDDGTHSRLRIDVVIAGTRTNRSSTNLASRLTPGQAFWVRGRIEGQTVVAEYISSTDGPPWTLVVTTSESYTLSGTEPTALVAGSAGWSWVPTDTGAFIDDFTVQPFARGAVVAPAEVSFLDAIPGTAPALADITISGDADNIATWALVAWSAHRGAQLGVYDTTTALSLSGWTETTDSDGLGGSIARETVLGAATFEARWQSTALKDLQPDDFTDGFCDLEVWARVKVGFALVNPKLAVSLRPIDATISYEEQNALVPNPMLTVPSAGTVMRFTRLGTLTVSADSTDAFTGCLRLVGSVDAGSAGVFGVDYLLLVPQNRRIAGFTNMPNDSYYPVFMFSGTKRVRSDLSGLFLGTLASNRFTDVSGGVGGSMIQIQPGITDFYVRTSNLIPDDPTSYPNAEFTTLTHGFSVDIVPRSLLLRSS